MIFDKYSKAVVAIVAVSIPVVTILFVYASIHEMDFTMISPLLTKQVATEMCWALLVACFYAPVTGMTAYILVKSRPNPLNYPVS